MYPISKTSKAVMFGTAFVWLSIAAAFGLASASLAHDHNRPDLDKWFMGLRSKISACCDGSEAVHLADVDWQTQDKPGSHYKVRIPTDFDQYQKALKGQQVPTVWVDVPDEALVNEPNEDGQTLVWPMYLQWNAPKVRCFMPGPET